MLLLQSLGWTKPFNSSNKGLHDQQNMSLNVDLIKDARQIGKLSMDFNAVFDSLLCDLAGLGVSRLD